MRDSIARIKDLPVGAVIVEIGSIRQVDDFGAGYSSPYFAEMAKRLSGGLHICDIEQSHIELARQVCNPIYPGNISYYCCNAEEMGQRFPCHHLDFLYLDSMDCTAHEFLPSAAHHLEVFLRMRKFIKVGAYVAIDDCYTLNTGKGALLAPYLHYHSDYELIDPDYTMIFRRVK